MRHDFSAIGRVTVSCGVTALRPGETEGRHMFERADQAMYVAKQEGRNRVAILE